MNMSEFKFVRFSLDHEMPDCPIITRTHEGGVLFGR